MEGWLWGLLLKPFYFLIVWVLLVWPVTYAVRRWMPEGRLKTALLRRRGEKPCIGGNGQHTGKAAS